MKQRMHAGRIKAGRANQRGQALIEFVVIALAIVPLFLLMPVIAKYQDIAHSTVMAGRYLAYDAAIRNPGMSSWKAPGQQAAEVSRRFFSNSDAPIKTNDTAGNFKANQNLFWSDPKGNALIKDFNADVRVSFGAAQGAAPAAAFSAASDNQPFKGTPLPFNVSQALSLESPGIYSANVSVALADFPSSLGGFTRSYEEFKSIGLTMTRHTSLLLDGWEAKNPQQVESRISDVKIFPGVLFDTTLKPLATAVSIAVGVMESPKYLPSVCVQDCGPKLGKLSYWRDVVPADRLR